MAVTLLIETYTGTQDALGPNHSHTELIGDIDLVSNNAVPQTLGSKNEAVCNTDLTTIDHFAELWVNSYAGTDAATETNPSVIVRAGPTGRTFYLGCIKKNTSAGDKYQIWKVVDGVYSLLAEVGGTAPSPPIPIKLRVDTVAGEAFLEFLADDVVRVTYTDSDPLDDANRTRVGIACEMGTTAVKPQFLDFYAHDLHTGTRFYLPSSGTAPLTSLGFGATGNVWDRTAQADRMPMWLVRSDTAHTEILRAPSGINPNNTLARQYQSEPIAAQTFEAGTLIMGIIRARETAGADNYCAQFLAKVVSNDGSVERGVLFALDNSALSQEFSGAVTSYGFPKDAFPVDGRVMSQVVAQDGDRIVFEVGLRATSTAVNSMRMNLGDASTEDLTILRTDVAALNPWIELDMVVVMQGEGGETISPTSIASAEAFGTAKLSLQVQPTAIASVEAHGTPKLSLRIVPTAVASTEAFGAPKLSTRISPSSIASAETFGAPKLSTRISPSSIASAEAFGIPTISLVGGAIELSPSSIASAEVFGVPEIGCIATVRSSLTSGTVGSQNIVVNKPAGILGGDEMWSVIRCFSDENIIEVPDGWAWFVGNATDYLSESPSSSHRVMHVFRKIASGPIGEANTEPASWTFRKSANSNGSGACIAFFGTHSDPIDEVSLSRSGSGASVLGFGIRSNFTNEIVVGLFGINSGASWTPDSHMTERLDSNHSPFALEIATEVFSTDHYIGNRTAVASSGTSKCALMIGLKSPSSVPVPPPTEPIVVQEAQNAQDSGANNPVTFGDDPKHGNSLVFAVTTAGAAPSYMPDPIRILSAPGDGNHMYVYCMGILPGCPKLFTFPGLTDASIVKAWEVEGVWEAGPWDRKGMSDQDSAAVAVTSQGTGSGGQTYQADEWLLSLVAVAHNAPGPIGWTNGQNAGQISAPTAALTLGFATRRVSAIGTYDDTAGSWTNAAKANAAIIPFRIGANPVVDSFSDNFNRGDEPLEMSGEWGTGEGGGEVLSNQGHSMAGGNNTDNMLGVLKKLSSPQHKVRYVEYTGTGVGRTSLGILGMDRPVVTFGDDEPGGLTGITDRWSNSVNGFRIAKHVVGGMFEPAWNFIVNEPAVPYDIEGRRYINADGSVTYELWSAGLLKIQVVDTSVTRLIRGNYVGLECKDIHFFDDFSAEILPGGPTQILTPGGIASAEAFGSPTLVPAGGVPTIAPSSISSSEAFGTPKLGLKVQPTAIASQQAFGTPKLSMGIKPTSIGSVQAFGTFHIKRSIALTGIASAQAFGMPRIVSRITIGSIASAQAFGIPRLGLKVSPLGIVSQQAFGVPSLSSRIYMQGIPSQQVFGLPALRLGIVVVGIPSQEVFGAFEVVRLLDYIFLVGIPSQEAFGEPIVGVPPFYWTKDRGTDLDGVFDGTRQRVTANQGTTRDRETTIVSTTRPRIL